MPCSGSAIRPASPGSRDANAGIAFKVCVNPDAPAFSPVRPCSYVAVEWPIDTLIACAVNDLMSAAESVSSGARVTSLTDSLRLRLP